MYTPTLEQITAARLYLEEQDKYLRTIGQAAGKRHVFDLPGLVAMDGAQTYMYNACGFAPEQVRAALQLALSEAEKPQEARLSPGQ